jgi:hypothetical protein
MRYKDINDTDPTQWTVKATKTEEHNGIKIPVALEANCKLDSGGWTWLKLELANITYNMQELPMATRSNKE